MEKKNTPIIVGAVVLVTVVIASLVVVTQTPKIEPAKSNSIKMAMDVVCGVTDFQDICKNRLTAAGGKNDHHPKDLIKLGFHVAKKELEDVMSGIHTFINDFKKPGVPEAVRMCRELLNDAISDIEDSYNRLNSCSTVDKKDVDVLLSDLQTWLSGAITYQQTCLDAFTGKEGEAMKERLKTSDELASNGLAMVTKLSSIFEDPSFSEIPSQVVFGGRKHIEEHESSHEFPSWVDHTTRKLIQATPGKIKPNVVVAQDGSGKYQTINEAIKDIPLKKGAVPAGPFVIHIKAGVYKERLNFTKQMSGVVLIGDGPTKTKITESKSFAGDGMQTYETATVGASGERFIFKDLAIENNAGPDGHQAVALRITSDRSVIYNCLIEGFQDTLYAHNHRQFYRDCTISGTVDFVMGDAKAVFQNCKMLIRMPNKNLAFVTAQSRKGPDLKSGFVLQNCTITAEPELAKAGNKVRAYLGRPWMPYAKVLIMNSQIDAVIHPDGWFPWNNNTETLNTLWYAELNNKGPGADTSKRVTWKGIKKITPEEAEQYSVSKFIMGDSWIPSTGVPYQPGVGPMATTPGTTKSTGVTPTASTPEDSTPVTPTTMKSTDVSPKVSTPVTPVKTKST
ncbi:pectinesterase-like [Cornus florida]|uniref:pectinesterase-like n=1 Tax=Cornus florida TaxID=4283 RepID=UPI002899C2AF|nr:pectinesterase-like [Cornus florida]